MRKIAVLNQKGGVGKTTIAVNLSHAIASKGKRVLLVDLDPQANATIALTPGAVSAQNNIYQILAGRSSLEQGISRIADNLHFISSDIELAGIEHELTPQGLGILRETFASVVDYDYVIFDCAPSLGLMVLSCLAYVEEVVIPIQAEFFALSGLSHLMKTIERVSTGMNHDLKLGGIILSMYDARKLMTREVEAEVRKYFGEAVFRAAIRVNVKIAEAQSHGKTVLEYSPDSNGSKDFLLLADEVIAREHPDAQNGARGHAELESVHPAPRECSALSTSRQL